MSGAKLKAAKEARNWRYDAKSGFVYANIEGLGSVVVGEVRGWGALTGHGPGGLSLTLEDAIEVHDTWGRKLAAAPDLLEALEELVVTADSMRAWIERQAAATPEGHAVIARARAAIGKATGEAS